MARLSSPLLIATLLTLMAASINLHAQGRGAHGGHPGAAVRTAPPQAALPVAVPAQRSTFVGHVTAPVHGAPFARGSHFPIVRSQPTIIVPQPFGFYPTYPWSYPLSYPLSAPIYTQSLYADPAYAPSPVVAESSVVSRNDTALSYEVQRLSQEIERLRAEQSTRLPIQQPPAAPQLPATPTTLVFRDGHRLEIQNYAIVGQTLWVLEERTSIKIALSDLDLDVTQRENRGRGVRFPLPEK